MNLAALLATAPDFLRALAVYDPDYSILGLLTGCTGGWLLASALQKVELARKRAQRRREDARLKRRGPHDEG